MDSRRPMMWKCSECEAITVESELLVAPNPFNPLESVSGCPACKAVADFALQCDEPECRQRATCGTPTAEGYAHTCGSHTPTAR